MVENCIPMSSPTMTLDQYSVFLIEIRKLIAKRLKEFYFSL
jgi:hypothetical protein